MSAPGSVSEPRHRDERGTALVLTLLVTTAVSALGLVYLTLGESAMARSRDFRDREVARGAARDALSVAASWFNAESGGSPTLPPVSEWQVAQRRGDADGDGLVDRTCDGSLDGGALDWKAAGGAHPFDPAARDAVLRGLCGGEEAPDLLLEGGPYNEDLAALLGEGVVVERLAVHAPPREGGRRLALASLSCTVAVVRRGAVVARERARAHVAPWPRPLGPEVIDAGRDVVLAPGSRVHWGVVQAGRDITLPPPGVDGFPASGLPRTRDGRRPADVAPDSRDWRSSSEASLENGLTELLGQTQLGVRVRERALPPALPDPWLSLRAGGAFGFEPAREDGDPPPGVRQPFPFRLGETSLEEDLSHLSVHADPDRDPFCAGALERLADAVAAGAPAAACRVRRLVPEAAGGGGEARWKEPGGGASRPASEWLGPADGEPELLVLDARSSGVDVVTVAGGRGILVVRAKRLVLAPSREAVPVPASLPGEPFLDSGVDLDHDGAIDPGTGSNGRWDADADFDRLPDEGASEAAAFELLYADTPWDSQPLFGRDPRTNAVTPHEPFLNLDYPASADDLSVRVALEAGRGGSGRPLADEGTTSMARDERGAVVTLPVHYRGLVVNLAGDVIVKPGFRLHGAVRAAGDVIVQPGAFVSFDADLARRGAPEGMALPAASLADYAAEGSRGESSPTRRPPGGEASESGSGPTGEAAPGGDSDTEGDASRDRDPAGSGAESDSMTGRSRRRP